MLLLLLFDFHIFLLKLSLPSCRTLNDDDGRRRRRRWRAVCATDHLFFLRRCKDFSTWNGRLVTCLHDVWSLLFFFCLSLFACRSAFLKARFLSWKLEFTRLVSAFNEMSEMSCRCNEIYPVHARVCDSITGEHLHWRDHFLWGRHFYTLKYACLIVRDHELLWISLKRVVSLAVIVSYFKDVKWCQGCVIIRYNVL